MTLRDLFDQANEMTDQTHGVATTLAASYLPLFEILDQFDIKLTHRRLLLDASVAISAVTKGFSKVLRYLTKTQGVDLGWVAEVIHAEGISVEKVGTKENVADLMTKGVDHLTLLSLLPMLGVKAV